MDKTDGAERSTIAASPSDQAGISGGRLGHLDFILALAILLGVLLMLLQTLKGLSLDPQDEGVYWQSLRSMSAGHQLFGQIFSSQPPGFLFSVYPFYLFGGASLAAGRLAIVVYSLLGLGAIYAIGRLVGGRLTGLLALAFLACDPLYFRESHTLQAEGPAISFGLISVALALGAARRERLGTILALLSGGLAALGILAKLFDIIFLAPILLALILPRVAHDEPDGDGDPRDLTRDTIEVQRAARLVVFWGAGLVAVTALVLLPFWGVRHQFYDQAVRFHLVAEHIASMNVGWRGNLRLLRKTVSLSYDGDALYGGWLLVSIILAVWRRAWRPLIFALVWLIGALALLLHQQPLLDHQTVLLSPSLALLAGAGLSRSPHSATSRARPGSPLITSLITIVLLVATLIVSAESALNRAKSAAAPPSPTTLHIASVLEKATRPGEVVATDAQYIAGLADRSVPPELVDTSQVRIQAGDLAPRYMDAGWMEAMLVHDKVRAVLFAGHRFILVRGFTAWVQARYPYATPLGGGATLYTSAPHQ